MVIDEVKSDVTFEGMFDSFAAPSYPANLRWQSLMGITGFEPGVRHTVVIQVLQSDVELGLWTFSDISVEREDTVMKLGLNAQDFDIPHVGEILFDVYVDEDKIDSVVITALQGDGA